MLWLLLCLATLAEILDELVRKRRLRAAARVVKRKMSSYGVKRAEHRDWPQPTRPCADAIRVLASPYLMDIAPKEHRATPSFSTKPFPTRPPVHRSCAVQPAWELRP